MSRSRRSRRSRLQGAPQPAAASFTENHIRRLSISSVATFQGETDVKMVLTDR